MLWIHSLEVMYLNFKNVLHFGVIVGIYFVSLINMSPHFLKSRHILDLKILDTEVIKCFQGGWEITEFKVIWTKAGLK